MWAIVTTAPSVASRTGRAGSSAPGLAPAAGVGPFPDVNALDLVILVLVALAAFTGFRRGALLQLFSYAGLILGVVVGALLAPAIASQAGSDAVQAGIVIVVLLGMAGIGDAIGWVAGTSVRARAHGLPVVGTAD
jgi:hypothetical protein